MIDIDLCDVGQRTLSFARRVWNESLDTPDEIAVEALAIAAVAATLIGDHTSANELVVAILNAIPAPRYSRAPLFTALAAAAIALKVDNAGFACEYIQTLAGCSDSAAVDANTVLVRLAVDGFAALKPTAQVQLSPTLLRTGNKDDSVLVAREVENHSEFGTVPIRVPEPLGFLLQGAALARFRAYDLPTALRLSRAARYSSEGSSTVLTSCCEFIRGSQGEDGSFGDYTTSFSMMERKGQRGSVVGIRMAVTLYSLWTLAELSKPGFRLVKELFGSHGLLDRRC